VDIKEGRCRRNKSSARTIGRTRRRVRAPGTSGDRAPIRRSLGRRRSNPSIPARGLLADSPAGRRLTFAADAWPRSRSHNVRGAARPAAARATAYVWNVPWRRGRGIGARGRLPPCLPARPPLQWSKGRAQLPVGLVPSNATAALCFVLICPWTWLIRHVTCLLPPM